MLIAATLFAVVRGVIIKLMFCWAMVFVIAIAVAINVTGLVVVIVVRATVFVAR